MPIVNLREAMLLHENPTYILARPEWTLGRIPALSDYRKLSVDSSEEAVKLAKYGQQCFALAFPNYKGKGPLRLHFTQALTAGAALLTRETANTLGLDFEKYRSVLLVCPSRFGKSFVMAGVLGILAGEYAQECNIMAASLDKADIIMNKLVQLLPYANNQIKAGLAIGELDGDSIDKKLKRMVTQVSRSGLAWKNGGRIQLVSTSEARRTGNGEVDAGGAIGIGGTFGCFDEIQLMSPQGFRTASRYMAENPNTKRFCVGNPMINGHFKELYDDPTTFVIHANDITAIVEERMTRKGFELTGMPTYSPEYRYYIETEFPKNNTGHSFFPSFVQPYDKAGLPEPTHTMCYMGIDSAYRGADALSVSVLSDNYSTLGDYEVLLEQVDLKKRYSEWDEHTNLNVCLDIMKMIERYNVRYVSIDIGVGSHIYEKLRELDIGVPLEPVGFGDKPSQIRTDYNARHAKNMRAEMHLDIRDACDQGKLYVNQEYYDEIIREMSAIGQVAGKDKIQVESKQDIKKRLRRSPDCLDSLCLAMHSMMQGRLMLISQMTMTGNSSDLMEVIR